MSDRRLYRSTRVVNNDTAALISRSNQWHWFSVIMFVIINIAIVIIIIIIYTAEALQT